jgi:PAS domain S-box-containing protein
LENLPILKLRINVPELSAEVYRSILESLPTGVYLVDTHRRITLWNDSAERLTGYLRQEMIGRGCNDDLMLHCEGSSAVLCDISCPLLQTMHDGQPRELDIFMRHKDGQRLPVRVRAVPIRDEHGAIVGAAACMDERPVFPIADIHPWRFGATLSMDAEVPNHKAILARLLAGLEDFEAGHIPFGLLSIAIDGLERLRHRDGHQAVNTVLHVTARTLSRNLGPNGTIGSSVSNDGFTAIVENSTAEALLKTAGLLKRLVSLEAIPWWGDRISVTLSMGGTMVRDGDTPESLLERADGALGASLLEHGDHVVVA